MSAVNLASSNGNQGISLYPMPPKKRYDLKCSFRRKDENLNLLPLNLRRKVTLTVQIPAPTLDIVFIPVDMR
jgi:hypothetical protein